MNIEGTVLSVTLTDVLCIPDCNEACLISWREVDMLCGFQIVGENSMITIQPISYLSPLCIANLMHECYQVLPLVSHNEIHTTATDVREQPLSHSSTRFCALLQISILMVLCYLHV